MLVGERGSVAVVVRVVKLRWRLGVGVVSAVDSSVGWSGGHFYFNGGDEMYVERVVVGTGEKVGGEVETGKGSPTSSVGLAVAFGFPLFLSFTRERENERGGKGIDNKCNKESEGAKF